MQLAVRQVAVVVGIACHHDVLNARAVEQNLERRGVAIAYGSVLLSVIRQDAARGAAGKVGCAPTELIVDVVERHPVVEVLDGRKSVGALGNARDDFGNLRIEARAPVLQVA